MKYTSQIDCFDIERGDALTLTREVCLELLQWGDDAAKVIMSL